MCLLLVLLAAIDYLRLLLRKRYFVKREILSIYDRKLKEHHQRIKSIEEINDYHKKRVCKIPEVREPEDQSMSLLIS